ncbi:hypothetical protein [Emticicia sp. SJ17W-69]|uniref:hypothetical protein n=1 Tax=Emticicia sp. SJ17W-69 TaxID=3421657 RepID=UPI003EBD1AE4
MKTYLSYICLPIIFLMACASEAVAPEMGALDVKVTIGPLCPVEPCNKTIEELKSIYASYSLVLTNSDSKAIVLDQKLTYNGTNGLIKSTNIAVGQYEMSIKPENIFTKRGFPKTIIIEKNKTASLEIEVDTGIR